MPGPLEGYRVVDLADAISGPYAAMELADAGADVIKIERPTGDRARGWGSQAKGDLGAAFLALNRAKRGVTLDLESDAGVAAADRIIAKADVVITDAQWSARPELQPDALRARHPSLVVCVVSLYGDRGPWANRAPYGEIAAEMFAENTNGLGVLGEAPVRIGTDMGSMFAGINAVQAILSALYARDLNGAPGQRIDVSLVGSLMATRSQAWVALTNPEEWGGFQIDTVIKPVDYGIDCSDGQVLFTIPGMSQEQRDKLYADLGMLDWVKDDPLYEIVNDDRGGGNGTYAHIARGVWNRATSKFTRAELNEIAERYGGNAFPFNNYDQVPEYPQIKHLGLVQTMEQPGVGTVTQIGPPWKFHDTPVGPLRPAPLLGEHTVEVLTEVGYSAEEVATMRRAGALGAS